MKNRKFGFTLGEVLICIMIIGIIMAIAARSIKVIKTSYTSLSYYEYQNVKEIAATMIKGADPGETGAAKKAVEMLLTDKGYKTIITRNDTDFCNGLKDMVNASGTVNCGSLFSADANGISNMNANSPTFTSNSGKRYYLSKRVAEGNAVSNTYGYRALAVDLNGKQAPNIMTSTTSLVPDIINFIILDNGEIFPVGVAANNYQYTSTGGKITTVQYLNSKVKGYYFSDITRANNQGVPEDCFLRQGSGSSKQVCNYAIVYLQNRTKSTAKERAMSIFTYREAYCTSLGKNRQSSFNNYCQGLELSGGIREEQLKYCPPADKQNGKEAFDECRIELVKPSFRFHLD